MPKLTSPKPYTLMFPHMQIPALSIAAALDTATEIERAKLIGESIGMDPDDVQQVIDSAKAAYVSNDVGCTLGELVRERMRETVEDHLADVPVRWLSGYPVDSRV